MTTTTDRPRNVHQGRNIKRFREMKMMKQETLAYELGEDWTQKKISLLEAKEEIEPEILEQVARVLNVSPEAIKNFTEEAAVNYFNTFNESNFNGANAFFSHNNNCNFNPLDELMKSIGEIKKLYERLLESEREKVALLEKLLEQRK
jgi:transcriptional regulator with XRE-family HTH domain